MHHFQRGGAVAGRFHSTASVNYVLKSWRSVWTCVRMPACVFVRVRVNVIKSQISRTIPEAVENKTQTQTLGPTPRRCHQSKVPQQHSRTCVSMALRWGLIPQKSKQLQGEQSEWLFNNQFFLFKNKSSMCMCLLGWSNIHCEDLNWLNVDLNLSSALYLQLKSFVMDIWYCSCFNIWLQRISGTCQSFLSAHTHTFSTKYVCVSLVQK